MTDEDFSAMIHAIRHGDPDRWTGASNRLRDRVTELAAERDKWRGLYHEAEAQIECRNALHAELAEAKRREEYQRARASALLSQCNPQTTFAHCPWCRSHDHNLDTKLPAHREGCAADMPAEMPDGWSEETESEDEAPAAAGD